VAVNPDRGSPRPAGRSGPPGCLVHLVLGSDSGEGTYPATRVTEPHTAITGAAYGYPPRVDGHVPAGRLGPERAGTRKVNRPREWR
jgi:hypothetical protein